MKELSPYWFLEFPIDCEHKYYVLLDFLQSVKKDLAERKYTKQVKKITSVYKDLQNFKQNSTLSFKTLSNLNKDEIDIFKKTLKSSENSLDIVDEIITESISIVGKFLETIEDLVTEANNCIEIREGRSGFKIWDNGFLVIRNQKVKEIKIYWWKFSIVELNGTENAALLTSELLEPLCSYSKDNKKIMEYMKTVNSYNEKYDVVIFSDVKTDCRFESPMEIGKEKGIEYIINTRRELLEGI